MAVKLSLLLVALLQTATAFTIAPRSVSVSNQRFTSSTPMVAPLYSSEGEMEEPVTAEEKEKAVGNLVENDEWEGLTMELSEVIKMAVVEDIKTKTRDFIGKDEYKVGDITKEVDKKVKKEIASMRGNEEYQLGDLVVVMDNMVSTKILGKKLSCRIALKPLFSSFCF